LWTAISLLEEGWSGKQLTIIEPSGKTEDDRTWSYWAKTPLLSNVVVQRSYTKIALASDGKRQSYLLDEYKYFSMRSSSFYAYAKGVLAKAGVVWIQAKVPGFSNCRFDRPNEAHI